MSQLEVLSTLSATFRQSNNSAADLVQSFNISLPAGTTTHGDPHLLCPPASWEDIFIFFIGNYVAHAATVKLPPGTSLFTAASVCIGCLLMPATGLAYGLATIFQFFQAYGVKSELERAKIAGALCMYARTDKWRLKGAPTGQSVEVRAKFEPYCYFESDQYCRKRAKAFVYHRDRANKARSRARHGFHTECAVAALQKPIFGSDWDGVRWLLRQPRPLAALPFAPEGPYWDTMMFSILFHVRTLEDDPAAKPAAEMSSPKAKEVTTVSTSSERPHEKPQSASKCAIFGALNGSGSHRIRSTVKVHGHVFQSEEYELVRVPKDVVVRDLHDFDTAATGWTDKKVLTKNHNVAKALIAVLQLVFSNTVLARASGNQTDVYGYAAFSLTVAPYAVMAAVNLLAQACVASYDALYVVENEVMEEIRQLYDLQFEGIVGKVEHADDSNEPPLSISRDSDDSLYFHKDGEKTIFTLQTAEEAAASGTLPIHTFQMATYQKLKTIELSDLMLWPIIAAGFLLLIAPLAIVGGISRFHVGNSTPVQRGVLMTWLSIGQIFGALYALFIISEQDNPVFMSREISGALLANFGLDTTRDTYSWWKLSNWPAKIVRLPYAIRIWGAALVNARGPEANFVVFDGLYALIYGIPAIWGFVIVAQMLSEYGNCIRVY